jgi:hypothetical protein
MFSSATIRMLLPRLSFLLAPSPPALSLLVVQEVMALVDMAVTVTAPVVTLLVVLDPVPLVPFHLALLHLGAPNLVVDSAVALVARCPLEALSLVEALVAVARPAS